MQFSKYNSQMKCSINHANMSQKFCLECGSQRESAFVCSNGHEVASGKNFCIICGESVKLNTTQDNLITRYPERSSSIPPPQTLQQSVSFDFSPQPEKTTNKNLPIFLGSGALVLIILIFIIVKLGGSSSTDASSISPSIRSVTVEMKINDEYDCFDLSPGYSDIPGAQVVISMDGSPIGFGSYSYFGTYQSGGCVFTAIVPGVPTNGLNYAVEMASGRRGTIYATNADLEMSGWTFSLSLG